MFDGGACLGGSGWVILRVLFPIPAAGLAELGRRPGQGPFYARFRITQPDSRDGPDGAIRTRPKGR